MIEEAKSGYFEEEIEKVRVWIGKKESQADTKLFSDNVSAWDKENIWEKVIEGLYRTKDDLDEVEGHLDTAKELFYDFLREHNIKVGGN